MQVIRASRCAYAQPWETFNWRLDIGRSLLARVHDLSNVDRVLAVRDFLTIHHEPANS